LRRISEKFVILLATGGCTGYLPGAPGTYGTLVAIPLCYLLSKLGPVQAILFVSGEAEKLFSRKDPGLIVIDEMAGFLMTLLFIPWSAKSLVIGFFVFRLMDITKPFPIKRIEAKLPGGWGVVGDDILAGIYANLVLRVVMKFF
jgi:phosphatidylglycerophosphatase A